MTATLPPPFDVMRRTCALAPHDPELNDLRGLVGETLRRRVLAADVAASETIRACSDRAGPAVWPVVWRVVIEDAPLRDCRVFTPEIVTPWRADAVLMDRLRVGLDSIAPLLGLSAATAKEERV